ncbi:hypothetical protein PG999_000104 [Apiospora kogelbergensis]|uniref:LPXTG-motif cell wall anchor domain-containing protein n=1 Tax=Apiospora kogelbergensis TaxID=1337665 RepID=A0AAW0RAY2_9PEZI
MSPCGNITTTATVLPCCGWGDKCLGNALCHVSDRIPPGTSGYYRAGCTDPNFPAPDCNPALGEPFQAPAPENLTSYFAIPKDGYFQDTASSTGEAQPSSAGNHVSAGASAGIGIGAGLGAVAIVVSAGLWFLRRRRRRLRAAVPELHDDGKGPIGQQQQHLEQGAAAGALTGAPMGHMNPQELGIGVARPELQA